MKTNHLIDGETHVPTIAQGFGLSQNTADKNTGYAALLEAIGEDAFAGIQLVMHLLVGWPAYLIQNASGGRSTFDGQRKEGHVLDHFRPSSKLFDPKIRHKILLGTVGILAFLAFLAKCCVDYGAMAVACYYFGPYLVVNGWLVLYTWLHHTDVNVPHFGADEWTWVKGALCTIDRPYGIFDWFHHDIGSTHVVHHLFSNMPFYHAAEATVHVKQFLGPLYNYDETPIISAAWKIAAKCQYMDSVEGVQYYKAMPRSKKVE